MKHFKTPLYSILVDGGNKSFAAAAQACEGSAQAPAQSGTFVFLYFLIDCAGLRTLCAGPRSNYFH